MKLQTRAPFHFHSDWMICIVLYVLWKLCPPPHLSKTNFGRCNETTGYSNPSTAKNCTSILYSLTSLLWWTLGKEEMCYECMTVCPDQRCCGFMWRALLPLFLSLSLTHTHLVSEHQHHFSPVHVVHCLMIFTPICLFFHPTRFWSLICM